MTLFEKYFGSKEFNPEPSLEGIRAAVREAGCRGEGRSIAVVGTNGKGSTSALLAWFLEKAGFRTGLFTSPHLIRFPERFKVGLEEVDDKILDDCFKELLPIIERHSLTYFEACFLIAVCIFKDCDVSIYEAGLGGRLDATNAVKHDAAIITGVSLDHTEILGKSVKDIAREKLHISRGIPLFVSKNPPVVARIASFFTKRVFLYGRDFSADDVCVDMSGTSFTYRSANHTASVRIALVGGHQAVNAATAMFVASKFFGVDPGNTLSIDLKIPGRFQVVRKEPLLILDVAHNTSSIKNLIRTLHELGIRSNIVYSSLRDKNVRTILKLLHGYTSSVGRKLFVTQIRSKRAMDINCIVGIARRIGADVIPTKELSDGIFSEDTVVTGSFYLIRRLCKVYCEGKIIYTT